MIARSLLTSSLTNKLLAGVLAVSVLNVSCAVQPQDTDPVAELDQEALIDPAGLIVLATLVTILVVVICVGPGIAADNGSLDAMWVLPYCDRIGAWINRRIIVPLWDDPVQFFRRLGEFRSEHPALVTELLDRETEIYAAVYEQAEAEGVGFEEYVRGRLAAFFAEDQGEDQDVQWWQDWWVQRVLDRAERVALNEH